MPRQKNIPYTCPSCGITFEKKTFMKRHFYERQKHCPRVALDITLTDEIKQYVLENRIWRPQKQTSSTPTIVNNVNNVNNVINNFNTMNNFLSTIEPIEKIKHYTNYKSIDTIPFEDKVDRIYSEQYDQLTSDKCPHFELGMDDIFDIIDEISQVNTDKIYELNVFYDEKGKKIVIYDGDWKYLRFKCAVKTILSIIKSSYTNAYEAYLIRRLKNSNLSAFKKQKTHELLSEYYRFLGSNDVLPGVKDEYVTGDIDSLDEDTRDEYYELYTKINNNMTKGEQTKIQKEIIDIVQRNSKKH